MARKDELARKTAALVKYIEGLSITEGRHLGKRFKVLGWQREVCAGLVSGKTTIPITMARGNGKTTLVAGVICAAIDPDGPLFIPRGQILLVASSLKQAAIGFRHIKYFMGDRIYDRKQWRLTDNNHDMAMVHLATGAELRVLGSDSKRAHGLAPSLMMLDEPAQWVLGGEHLFVALDTARGKQMYSVMMPIGTRPEAPDHWFNRLLDSEDQSVLPIRHIAAKEDDEFSQKAVLAANPSYRHLPELRGAITEHKRKAKRGGLDLHSWRALRLNMGTPEVGATERIVQVENWEACVVECPPPKSGPVFLGIDLGGGSSMSAAAAYWAETGRLETFAAFPALPTLKDRGKADAVGSRYADMKARGELRVYPGRSTNNLRFLGDVLEYLKDEDILKIGADQYKHKDVEHALNANGMDPESMMEWRRVGRGPSGTEDVTGFQRDVLDAHLRCAYSLSMESAVYESVLLRDTNGNAALDKRRARGRIDVLQAAIIAVGMGYRYRNPSEGPGAGAFWAGASGDVIEAVG